MHGPDADEEAAAARGQFRVLLFKLCDLDRDLEGRDDLPVADAIRAVPTIGAIPAPLAGSVRAGLPVVVMPIA